MKLNKPRKQYLGEGSLRTVMANEIRNALGRHTNRADAAKELGICIRTLRNWMRPVDRGGWPELQLDNVDISGAIEMITDAMKYKKRKKK